VPQRKIRNMEEFATVSGISRPTLSKYFNNPDSVRTTTRKRIEKALDQHDYRPNVYAMNQNRRLTKNIGVVVPYLADPFFAEIARRLEELCIASGYRPILLSSHGKPELEAENLESLRSLKPAGVLLAPFGRGSDRKTIEKIGRDVPLVLFDANISDTGEGFIGTDNFQSVGLMVEYLCRSGWSAPIEWSIINVSAWSAFGLSGRCFRALVDGIPERCAVGWCCNDDAISRSGSGPRAASRRAHRSAARPESGR